MDVSSKMTAETWLKGQPAWVQNKSLGVERAQLFRDGKIGLKDLVRGDMSRVPLRELRGGSSGLATVAIREAPRAVTFAEAEAYAAEVGAPIVPGTLDDAVGKMADAFAANLPKGEVFDRVRYIKNWKRNFGSAVESVGEEGRLALQNAVNQAFESGRFQAATAKHGRIANVPLNKRAIANADALLPNAAASYQGNWAAYYKGDELLDLVDPILPKWLKRAVPLPGEAGASRAGGLASTVRHEYGHHIWRSSITRRADSLRWNEAWGVFSRDEIKAKISGYAATNHEEAFCEMFAMVTDPLFNRALFADDVQSLIDIILEIIG